MAGGPLAAEVVCMVCLEGGLVAMATRVREGIESDQYRCRAGHAFGMDWSSGPATESLWPPPADLLPPG